MRWSGDELARAEAAVWISPWVEPGFAVHDVVPSWNAVTPAQTAVDVALQGRDAAGETPWYALGRWGSPESGAASTSHPGQDDGRCNVDVDTLVAPAGLDAFRVRVAGTGAGVSLSLVAAVACGIRGDGRPPVEMALRGSAVELDVPAFSQFRHRGHLPEYGGGGASWCSAASTAMLLAFWRTGPAAVETAWVGASHPDACVDHAARWTYDSAYGGCGNWPFNTAYAAGFGLEAFVTRLRSLHEAEAFLAAGIPLALSLSAGPGELDGFLAAGSAGHLVVFVGVTGGGDPIVNDPAAETNADVRRVYDRSQLERAWLRGSGGIVYVVRPPGVSLPPAGGSW